MKYLWYAFLGVFIVTGFSLVVLNSAGVIFGLGLLGFAALLQLLWTSLHQNKKLEAALNANGEYLAVIAYQSERTAQHLEQIANEAPAPPPTKQNAVRDVCND